MEKAENFFRRWGPIGIFTALVFSPNLVAAYFLARDESMQIAVYLLLFSLMTSMVPMVLVKTLRQFFIVYVPLAFIASAYVGYTLWFRRPPSEGIVAAVIHTNFGEAFELVALAGWGALISLLWGGIYTVFVFRSKTLHAKVGPRSKKIFAAACAIYLIAAAWNFEIVDEDPLYGQVYHFISADGPHKTIPLLDKQTIQNSFPIGLAHALFSTASLNDAVASSSYRFHAHKRQAIADKEIHILIIGESARFKNWGANGYARPTSPHLSARAQQGQVISFSDMAAQSNLTSFAAGMMVSGQTPAIYASTKKIEATVADAFKESGFTTGWISNQDFMYPPAVDFSDFDWSLHRLDEAMLPVIERALARHDNKTFLVIHTRGSHTNYDQRYAKRYKVFAPTLDDVMDKLPPWARFKTGQGATSKDMREALVNSYDNSILATDDLINEVVSLVESKHAVSTVLYVSDHGEDLCDDDRQLFMHGKANATKYEIHIPAFLWTSAEFRARYPEKQEALKEHASSKLSQANVLPTLLDMADVSWEKEDLTKSFASKKFVEPARRDVLTAASIIETYEDLK